MVILHAPLDIAGQAGLSVAGLRAIGQRAYGAFEEHPFAYERQADFPLRSGGSALGRAGRLAQALRLIGRFDVYHYHFARSLLPERSSYVDARINRRLGKRVIVEFWGSDVRMPGIESARNPYYVNSYDEDDAVARRRME